MNSINKIGNKCFQYNATVALNHERIKKDSQQRAKHKLFKEKHNWERINYPSEKDNWKNFEKNNLMVALCIPKKKKYISFLFKPTLFYFN